MKTFLIVVLGLILGGCYSPVGDDEMKDKYGNSGGWSATGTMRNDGKSSAAHLQVNFSIQEGNPIPSKNYTVQFAVGIQKDPTTKAILNPQTPINPVATIKWSVAGNDVTRVVDVTNGMSLTGVGEGIKVTVQDKTIQANITPAIYQVDITVAPGSRPSENQPATLTAFDIPGSTDGGTPTFSGLFLVPPATQLPVFIPTESGVISSFVTVYNITDPTTPVPENVAAVQLIDNNNVTQRIYDPRIGWTPVTPQARALSLINNFPAVYTLAYSITWGIDG